MREDESRLVLAVDIAGECNALMPLAPFTMMQIAASKSTNDILRDARMVPEVTENCLPQALHLKRRRVVMP